jgi:Pyridoxamine 5'-phosphate oxidase
MAKFHSELNQDLRAFIAEQKLFFTATAAVSGRINLSPKGMDTFQCIDDRTVAYLDLTGSGNETSAHLQADTENNGRMTIMFCSFAEKPLILRLYGHGRVIMPRHQDWDKFYALFESIPGERQIVVMELDSVQTSCGFAVPIYDFKEERKMLKQWAIKKGKQGITDYWREKNQKSIDGLATRILDN